jgi:putative transposase
MPRPLRLEYENAWYHVMNRGAARQDIYKNDQHRLLFLNLLKEASLYYNIEIHAYCLMDNHYHLLIHTPRGNLSQAMRHINGLYTQVFNRSEKIDGSLFRGRYKAILVEEDSYLLQVSRYIHLNPVTAGLTQMRIPLKMIT